MRMFPPPRSVLALDVGDARVGIAMSDPLGILARPFGNLDRGNTLFPALVELINREAVKTIVVGFPLELDGTAGEQAKKVESFVAELRNYFKQQKLDPEPEIAYWDERLTTVEANRIIAGSREKNRGRRELLDRVAATLILEGYLNRKRSA